MLGAVFGSIPSSAFMPHGHCFLWTPSLLWIYVVSESVIAAAYYSIPFALWFFARKRRDLPFRWVFVLFGAFVMACGTTHLLSLWNIWHADYWIDAGMKAITALASIATAVVLWPLVPHALAIPGRQDLEHTNLKLLEEIERRRIAEDALKDLNRSLDLRIANARAELEYKNTVLSTQQETSLDAMLLVDEAGRIVSYNRRFVDLWGLSDELVKAGVDAPVMQAVLQKIKDPDSFLDRVNYLYEHRNETSREELELADGRIMDRHSAPVVGRDGAYFGRVWYFRDVTERRTAETAMARQKDLYEMLSQTNQAIVRSRDRNALFTEVCRIAVEYGHYHFAAIRMIDAERHFVQVVARFGEDHGYLDQAVVSMRETDAEGRGAVGEALRAGVRVIINDFVGDIASAPWHDAARRAGVGAVGVFPLRLQGKVIGAIGLYAEQAGFFTRNLLPTLDEMAVDVSFALDNFAREASRKLAEETLRAAEEQFRGLVEQAIAGIYIIQDGKIAYVNPRAAEILGHGPAEEMVGADPLTWVAKADRNRVAEAMSGILEGGGGSMALDFGVVRRDGTAIQVGAHAARASHNGRPAIIGLVQDISEKQRAEEQIKQYVEQLQNAFMNAVSVATRLSEMRDPYTAGHERRVGEIAAAIAGEMGLDARAQEGLRVAGYLHDVGKINVPTEILAKPGKLSKVEFALIQGHPQAGYDVLKDVEFPWPVAEITLQHHERIDGSGYPRGLKGDAILREARILAIADTVEAMSSHRPYRPGLGLETALAEIERGSGTQYDPEVVAVCLRLFRDKGFVIPA